MHRIGPRSELHVVHTPTGIDGSRRRLYRLIESNSGGDWIVSLFVASLPTAESHPFTIVVEVERLGVDVDTALMTVNPPRIVNLLLGTLHAYDGVTKLTGHPIIVRLSTVDQAVAAVVDQERTASVVVAGSLGPEHDAAWHEVVASLTRQSVGVAATFVVYADAMAALDSALSETHQVGRGRIRTFLPQVDMGLPSDAFRHKWLGPSTLQRSLRGKAVARPLQVRHAGAARRRLVEAELPADVQSTIDLLERAATGVERAARVAARVAQSGGPESIQIRHSVGGVTDASKFVSAPHTLDEALGLAVENAQAGRPNSSANTAERLAELDRLVARAVTEVQVADEQLSEAAHREERLRTELTALRRRIEDMELDLNQAEQDEVQNQHELSILRRRLSQGPDPSAAFVEPQDDLWAPPESVEELLRRVTPGSGHHPVFRRVVFTGAESDGLEIDRRYVTGLYARSLWQYVRVLHDYAEARASGSFSGSVHMYLTDDRVAGEKCHPARHASTESETVLRNAKWRADRVFPVPESVHASGKVLMDAHFKPTYRDTFAPRMHYFDDVMNSGKVYVGYIGRHLGTKQS